MSSFKSSKNIQKKEGGPERSVSDNQSSSVTLNELAMKARKDTVKACHVFHADIVKLCKMYSTKISVYTSKFNWVRSSLP